MKYEKIVEGNLVITQDNLDCDFSNIEEVKGYVQIYCSVNLQHLRIVGDSVSVTEGACLEAPRLQTINTHVEIDNGANLEAPMLQTVGEYVSLASGASLYAPMLQSVGDYVYTYTTASLEAPMLQSVGDYVSIAGYANLTMLQTVGGDINIVVSVNLPNLQTVGGNINSSVAIYLPLLQTVGNCIHTCKDVKLEAPLLRVVGKDIVVCNNLNLPNLQVVGGDIVIFSKASLKAPVLQAVGGSISVNYNAKLEAPNLQVSGCSVCIHNATNLPMLQTVRHNVYIYDDTRLTQLQSVAGEMSVHKGANLKAPMLQVVGRAFYACNYAKIDAPLLQNNKLLNNEDLEILRKNITNTIFDEFLKLGFVFADGILSKKISKKNNVYKVQTVSNNEINYVVEKDGYFAHGKTIKKAYADLMFKLQSDRGSDQYANLNDNDKKDVEFWVTCYRVITGACKFGVEHFLSNTKLKKDKYTLKEVMTITSSEYGNTTFRSFFNQ